MDSGTRPANHEYGRDLFGHTSAVFVDVDRKHVFNPETARSLLEELERSRKIITDNALFADDSEAQEIDAVYKEALSDLTQRIESHRE